MDGHLVGFRDCFIVKVGIAEGVIVGGFVEDGRPDGNLEGFLDLVGEQLGSTVRIGIIDEGNVVGEIVGFRITRYTLLITLFCSYIL